MHPTNNANTSFELQQRPNSARSDSSAHKKIKKQHRLQIPKTTLNACDTLIFKLLSKFHNTNNTLNKDNNNNDQAIKRLTQFCKYFVSWQVFFFLLLLYIARFLIWTLFGPNFWFMSLLNILYLLIQILIFTTNINLYFAFHVFIQFESIYKYFNGVIFIISYSALLSGNINTFMKSFINFNNILYIFSFIFDLFLIISFPAYNHLKSKKIKICALFLLLLFIIYGYVNSYFLININGYISQAIFGNKKSDIPLILTEYVIYLFKGKVNIRSISLSSGLNLLIFFLRQLFYTIKLPSNQFKITIESETEFVVYGDELRQQIGYFETPNMLNNMSNINMSNDMSNGSSLHVASLSSTLNNEMNMNMNILLQEHLKRQGSNGLSSANDLYGTDIDSEYQSSNNDNINDNDNENDNNNNNENDNKKKNMAKKQDSSNNDSIIDDNNSNNKNKNKNKNKNSKNDSDVNLDIAIPIDFIEMVGTENDKIITPVSQNDANNKLNVEKQYKNCSDYESEI